MPYDFYSQSGAGPPSTWDVGSSFRTAKQQMIMEERLKQGRPNASSGRDISSFFVRPSSSNKQTSSSQNSYSQPLPVQISSLPPSSSSSFSSVSNVYCSQRPLPSLPPQSQNHPYVAPYFPPSTYLPPSAPQPPSAPPPPSISNGLNGAGKRLGVNGPFVNPSRPVAALPRQLPTTNNPNMPEANKSLCGETPEFWANERVKSLEKDLVEKILNEIVERKSPVVWEDIAGLWQVKNELDEIVTLPLLRPDLFVGLLSPCKGVLLFGPPGTGKTLIGKCVACKSKSTFFSISASSLTSKWVGEGEKLVRTLFAIARVKQPSIIFIDEIDSLLTKRNSNEHEASRRLKTEFLLQFDGIGSDKNESLLVIGATNRPQELDDAARRRFTKRLYIPLPNHKARHELISRLMKKHPHQLVSTEISRLCKLTKGFSGADVDNLCRDAAKNTIRRIGIEQVIKLKENESLPPITFEDFESALKSRKPSVSPHELHDFVQWNKLFGAIPEMEDNDDANEGEQQRDEGSDEVMEMIPVQEMKRQKLTDDIETQKITSLPVKSEPFDDDIQVLD